MKRRNPRVYLQFQIGNKKAGEIVIELFSDIVAKAAENFLDLCTGERGLGRETGLPLCYAGCKVTKIIPGQYMQCGDFQYNNGRGGESVFGGAFEDENFNLWHGCAGIVTMHNTGADSNRSQFYITFKAMPLLNRRNVIVGQVRRGMEVVRAIEKIPTNDSSVPRLPVIVYGCGIFTNDAKTDFVVNEQPVPETEGVKVTAAGKGLALLESFMNDNDDDEQGGNRELYCAESIQIPTAGRIWRKNKVAEAREIFDERQTCHSASFVQALRERLERQNEVKGLEFSIWNEKSVFNKYDKMVRKLRPDGSTSVLVSKTKKRTQGSRNPKPNEDVTYINYRNKLFNKKLEKAYGNYVVDIKQNLERGTAL